MTALTTCHCGCGQTFPAKRSGNREKKFVSPAHQTDHERRAWRFLRSLLGSSESAGLFLRDWERRHPEMAAEARLAVGDEG